MNDENVLDFYEKNLKIIEGNEPFTIEDVNRSLANWHGVSVYLIRKDSDLEKEHISVNSDYDSFIEERTIPIIRSLKAEFGNSYNPTQAVISSKFFELYKDEYLKYKNAKANVVAEKAKIEKLIRMIEKFQGILMTLSSNMRTDFMNSGRGSNPQAPRRVQESNELEDLKKDMMS